MNEHVKKLKILMLEKGINMADVAHKLGVSRQAVCDVVWYKKNSKPIQRRLSRILGVSVYDLFPDYKPARRRAKAGA